VPTPLPPFTLATTFLATSTTGATATIIAVATSTAAAPCAFGPVVYAFVVGWIKERLGGVRAQKSREPSSDKFLARLYHNRLHGAGSKKLRGSGLLYFMFQLE
jgi:hypothetical protein